ncbi:MAG: hypothetical protein LH473_03740 [Chitinophagales bacterium]|nr:hypothetical protein [Chitinophagales bacterium]
MKLFSILKTYNSNAYKVSKPIIYCLLLVLALTDRWMILSQFAFKYTDHDQTLMWSGAREMMHGLFHEPCFYGQNYNTMMEGLFSVPLICMGLLYPVSLPLLTSALALFPYLLFSLICLRKKKYINACIILLICILLPAEYGMMSSMSRGFVTGIFVASIACMGLFHPNNKSSWFLFGLFGTLSFWVNGNSVLLIIPVFIFLFLHHARNFWFYVFTALGFIPAAVWIYFAFRFYVLHPGYIFYQSIDYSFSFQLLFDSFKNLNSFFNDVTPLFWNAGWLVLILIVIESVILFIQKILKQQQDF